MDDDNIKLCYAFLTKDKINREDIWKEYLTNETEYDIIIHYYSDTIHVGIPFRKAVNKQTSWDNTTQAHFSLFESFLGTDCTHFVLLSESCVPLRSPSYIKKYISNANGTLLTYLSKHPSNKYSRFWNYGNKFRNNHHIKNIVTHEQWVIYSRKEVEQLLGNKDYILKQLSNVGADNEIVATFLPDLKICEGRHWNVNWDGCRKHPKTLRYLDVGKTEGLFARKVDAETEITNYNYNMDIDAKQKTIKIFVHFYHIRTYRDLVKWIGNIQAYAKLNNMHVQLHWSLTYGQDYPESILEKIQESGTVTYYDNKGYDIYPFLNEIKKWGSADYVYKMHSKNNDTWRRKLIQPLANDSKKIESCFKMLEDKYGWAVCARNKKIKGICDKEKYFTKLCNKYKHDNAPASYCSGTVYLFKKECVDYMVNMDIDFDNFEKGFLPSCESYTHAWEFYFGKLISINGKLLKGA